MYVCICVVYQSSTDDLSQAIFWDNSLHSWTKLNLVGQTYCTFTMGESLTICNNVLFLTSFNWALCLQHMCVSNTTLRTYTNAKSWLTWNSESGLKSRGEAAGGSHNNTCRFILAKAVSDHSVLRNSGSINSVASLIVNTTNNHTSICTNMDVYKH